MLHEQAGNASQGRMCFILAMSCPFYTYQNIVFMKRFNIKTYSNRIQDCLQSKASNRRKILF